MAQFKPGQSGNPGGRPKEANEVKELARKHTEQAITTLAQIMVEGNNRDKVAAAVALLDRGYGKPHQTLDAEFRGSLTSVIEALPMHRLRELPAKDEPELLPAPGNGQ